MSLNEITIEVTQQCPNRCIYCSSLSNMEKTECLDNATIIQVVDDAVALGVKVVSLSGGEPFLREDIVDIVDYIQEKGLKVRLYSSGIYSKDGEYTSIPSKLLQSVKGKLDSLIFNYEAIDAVLYAAIMGTQPSNMALLNDTINRAITLGLPVEAHVVPMRCNYLQIPEILNKLYSMGVSNVSFLRLVPQGRVLANREQVLLGSIEMGGLRQILAKCQEDYQGRIRLGLPFSANRSSCETGSIKLTVRYDGYVFPCEAFKDGMMKLENGAIPENVNVKRLYEIYKTSSYLRCIRDGLKAYTGKEDGENCYGQYLRANYSN